MGFRSTPRPPGSRWRAVLVLEVLSFDLRQCGVIKSWAWPAPQGLRERCSLLHRLVAPLSVTEGREDRRLPLE